MMLWSDKAVVLDQHAIVSHTDAQGVITYVNDRFCLISGYSREELIGKNHRFIKSTHHPASFYAELWDTITKGEVWHGDVCNRRKSGELYWLRATIVPLMGPDGFVQEYVAIRTDITDRKRVESSLEVARDAAEQASVAKSQFLANMSHEIRTPMNAILGMLQMLQCTRLTDEQKDFAAKIEGAARSLSGLLNDIRNFSKVEAGKMESDVRPFVVADLMGDLEVILASNIGDKPVRLSASTMPVASTAPAVLHAQTPTPPSAKVQRLQGMRLLLVEDNKINQMVAQGLLSQEGAVITLAENGALGVQAVANAQPAFDAVLMDLQMPVMDGLEATRSIRQDLGITHLPIIAMTANAMASDREACLAVGMNEHIGKPFELDHLVTVLRRLVRPVAPAVQPKPRPVVLSGQAYPSGDLDVDGALSRVGGDHGIYASVLQAFVVEMELVPQQLQAQWASGPPELAMRTLYTLKGLAATVGARHLSAVAAQLEQALKQGAQPSEHPSMLAQLLAAMSALSDTLLPVLQRYQEVESEPLPIDDAPLNIANMVLDLHTLSDLLRDANMLALEAHAKVHKLYASHLGSEMDTLHDAMAHFDFAAARQACDQLMARYAV
jgi:PAS domain S-box-containing protein